jgi:hypothetical protein
VRSIEGIGAFDVFTAVSLKNPTLVECYIETVGKYRRIDFTKSPASGVRNFGDPRLMSQFGESVRISVCFCNQNSGGASIRLLK